MFKFELELRLFWVFLYCVSIEWGRVEGKDRDYVSREYINVFFVGKDEI